MFNNHNNRASNFWLSISLLATLYYGLCFYYFVFNQEYIVQDDTRQHVIWLQRFIDPELFPHDLIADYFSGLALFGFKSIYLFGAKLGLEPILLAITTSFSYYYHYLFLSFYSTNISSSSSWMY